MTAQKTPTLESEAGFRALFEHATVGILVVSRGVRIELVNPHVEKLFGYSNAELIGQPLELLVPDALRKKDTRDRNDFFMRPQARPMGQCMDLQAKHKNGKLFRVEISLGHYEWVGEKLAVAFISDITEREQIGEKLRGREKFLSSIYNEANDAIFLVDPLQNRIIEANSKASEMLGYSHEELLNTSMSEIHPGEMELMAQFFGTLQVDGAGRTDELTCTTKSKKVIPADISASLIEIEGRQYMLAIIRDITERKMNEQKIMKLNKTLEKKVEKRTRELEAALKGQKKISEMKSRFVSLASHEFRTPLSTILSSTDLIEIYDKPSENEKREKHINRIRTSVQNLTEILNDFLSLDKLEQGKIEAEKETFDLQELAQGVVEDLDGILKEGQRINYKYSGESKVLLDKKILRNVLLNLLSNAIKYSAEGKEIDLYCEIKAAQVSIVVKDRGIGIPEDEQKNMFHKFFRAKNATNVRGTGLGLNILKQYLHLMGGTIEFTSKENKGSSFVVKLPKKI